MSWYYIPVAADGRGGPWPDVEEEEELYADVYPEDYDVLGGAAEDELPLFVDKGEKS